MKQTISIIAAGWALAGGAVLLLITLVTSLNIGAFALDRIARLFGSNIGGLPGYEDFVRVAISSAALMFFPYCQLRRGHVAIDLFTQRLPAQMREILNRFWAFATAALALFLAYWMAIGLYETYKDRTATSILGWLEWPFYAPGIVSLLLWALIAMLQGSETAGGRSRGA